ncbi:hypothetical protein C8D88_10443 [Lentzea atacamensis]|uniref:HEAT repeat-containing protein n=1 Tax=Lentzea atacamensis TaxID=531938 RepID=A0A316I903_9PSEU|nr:hypothetical protein [Lentzea atacamensis]PWK86882.1 hypothetical protein C8D88_10443 [Lentzea atacamensis]
MSWNGEWLSAPAYADRIGPALAVLRTSQDTGEIRRAASTVENAVAHNQVLYRGAAQALPSLLDVLDGGEAPAKAAVYDVLTEIVLAEPDDPDVLEACRPYLRRAVDAAWRDAGGTDEEVVSRTIDFLGNAVADPGLLGRGLREKLAGMPGEARKKAEEWLEELP